MDKHMQLSAATAFFDLGIIVRNQLRFHEDIRPSFEDAHFVERYIAFAGQGNAAFLKRARYFYRKRMDGSSTLDNSTRCNGLYLDVLLIGSMDLSKFYKDLVADMMQSKTQH